MSKSSIALESMPGDAARALVRLGEHLALARVRRNESQRVWAQRLGISAPTLIRMERGDPAVSMGVYATALWMIGLVGRLGEMASPEQDVRALEAEVRVLSRKRASRQPTSLSARLARRADADEPTRAAIKPLGKKGAA